MTGVPITDRLLKLPIFMPDMITRPDLHTCVGYPPLPTCLPKLLGTREDSQKETDGNMNRDQPGIDVF